MVRSTLYEAIPLTVKPNIGPPYLALIHKELTFDRWTFSRWSQYKKSNESDHRCVWISMTHQIATLQIWKEDLSCLPLHTLPCWIGAASPWVKRYEAIWESTGLQQLSWCFLTLSNSYRMSRVGTSRLPRPCHHLIVRLCQVTMGKLKGSRRSHLAVLMSSGTKNRMALR